ncbi:MAG: methyltransferase domain-containing protein [Ardenticatenaceae bacterium]|nr:methyltransferase domain-containing protein [Anaerolineales bacterium]MCB8923087.1 methyltransferase domain-containing protein [Ardenticatenaceae bacterium]
MELDDLHFLLSSEGARLLAETAVTPVTPDNHLQIATQLRRKTAHAQTVLETILLRQLAAAKFSRAAEMYFVREALEQASSEEVAAYRARRFAAAGVRHVADLGCGIGGDSLALAAHAEVTGVDWDPVRVAMAQENVRVYGYGDRFHPLQADLLALTPLPVDACFFDPARRDEQGRRIYSVQDYRPPLSLIQRWRTWVEETAVKISPGVNYDELPPDAEVEFISVKGNVKDGVLWFGDLRTGAQRRATLLPGEHTLTDADLIDVPITAPQAYLYEPDKAVIRAHLVEALAGQLGAAKIDADIAYLTANEHQATPFARCFAVEDVMPFQLKRLRHYLRERRIGQVTIKKRGSPLEPEQLRHQLRLQGEGHCVLFLTFVRGETAVIIGQEI